MVDEIVVDLKTRLESLVVAHELPDVFDRVEFRAFWRQRNDGDIGRHDEALRHMPASLVDQKDGMGSRRNGFGDLRKMQVHRLAAAGRHADSDRCRPGFRDDLAHHSDLKSPTRSEMMSPTIPG